MYTKLLCSWVQGFVFLLLTPTLTVRISTSPGMNCVYRRTLGLVPLITYPEYNYHDTLRVFY